MFVIYTSEGYFTACLHEQDARAVVFRLRKQGTMAWLEQADGS